MNEINIGKIENFMKLNNLSKQKFCVMCKISLPTFNKILLDKTNFRLLAIFKITKEMKINICQLFEK